MSEELKSGLYLWHICDHRFQTWVRVKSSQIFSHKSEKTFNYLIEKLNHELFDTLIIDITNEVLFYVLSWGESENCLSLRASKRWKWLQVIRALSSKVGKVTNVMSKVATSVIKAQLAGHLPPSGSFTPNAFAFLGINFVGHNTYLTDN